MRKPTPKAKNTSTLRQRAARARDEAGRFIRHAAGQVTDQPQPASLPQGSAAEPWDGAFPVGAGPTHDASRGHPDDTGRAGAADGQGPRREHDMGRHETFENAAPIDGEIVGVAIKNHRDVMAATQISEHEDADLLALVDPFRTTLRAAQDAETAAGAAIEAYRAIRPDRPPGLYRDTSSRWPLFSVREEDAEGWVPDATGSYANPRYVVTAATLREDLEESAPRSKAARLAKAKLPIAEAYETAETAARERSGVTAALAARDDARKGLERAAAEALTMKAGTAQGIAFQAAILGAVERPGSNMAVYHFVMHGRGLPASITAALGNPLLAECPVPIMPPPEAAPAVGHDGISELANGGDLAHAALIALEAEFLATDAAFMAAVGAASEAWDAYVEPPMPKALRVWANDWIHNTIPQPKIDSLPDGRCRQRSYGEREVAILRTTPCMAVYIGGTEGEPQPGGGRLRIDKLAQARADAIVSAWDEWQAQISAAKEAANLPALTDAKESAREARNAVLQQIREATAAGLAGLAVKARIAANMASEHDPKATARSYDVDDSDGLLLDLTGDVLALTGGLPAAHGGEG